MVLRLNRNYLHAHSKGARLCFGLLYWYIIAAVLVGFGGFPKIIMYFGDIINIWIFLNALKNQNVNIKKNIVLGFIVVFMTIALVSGLINLSSPLLLFWGIRQNFRFFLYYYSCTVFLRRDDYRVFFNFVSILFWLSLPLCIYEVFCVSYTREMIVGDYVGGIYYGLPGVNAPLNIVLIIQSSKCLVDYFNKKTKVVPMLITIGAALAMAIFADLKFFIIELVIIVFIVIVRKGISIKTFFIIALGIIGAGLVVRAYVYINGSGRSYYTTDYFKLSSMLEEAFRKSGYDGTGDLNRFSAVPTLIQKFFPGNLLGMLLGLGLGNAEYSQGFSVLTSNFYNAYHWLHYQYFSISFVFIETGLLGLFTYIMIFVSGIKQGLCKLYISSRDKTFFLCMVCMMLVLIVYNPCLRNEQCGYILYMILAMPMTKQNTENRKVVNVDS